MSFVTSFKCLRLIFAAILLNFAGCLCDAAVTVTAADGVIYAIQEGTMTVKVSVKNTSLFNDRTGDITISQYVYDTSNTVASTDAYEVIGFESGAFKGCVGLTGVTITAPVDQIPDNCFNGCTNITYVNLPSTVSEIGEYAFSDCQKMKTCTVTDQITSIGKSAFYNCYAMESIDLGEGLTEILNNTFENCTSLKRVTMPSTITKLNYCSFKNCSSLEEVALNEGLTHIQEQAFSTCTSLKAPHFPSTLTTLGYQAFAYCTSLGDLVLNEGVYLYWQVFYKAGMTSITFPAVSPITYHSGEQFYGVEKLKEVTIPGHQPMCEKMFSTCPDLEKVTFADGFTTVTKQGFKDCPKLTTLVMPSSLATIKTEAFSGCTALTDLTFPPSMDMIETEAFGKCTGIGTLKLPAGVMLCNGAFRYSDLTAIEFPRAAMQPMESSPFGAQDYITSLFIPGEIAIDIPRNMCYEWASIEKVEIGEGLVKNIGQEAFKRCPKLSEVILPSTLETIGAESFYLCPSLTAIEFPEGLVGIRKMAFVGTNLVDLVFPSTLRWLGDEKSISGTAVGPFEYISSIKSVYFKEGCRRIDERAFNECTGLTDLHLPSTLDSICSRAFYKCNGLTKIELDGNLKWVESSAFGNCYRLAEVWLPAGCVFDGPVFSSSNVTTIHFPEEPCIFLGENCFGYNTAITSVGLPQWLETIPQGMFYHDYNLTTATWSENLTKVSDKAFYNCKLTSINLPATTQWVGKNAFAYCVLGDLSLPAGCYFDEKAFECASTTSITFPETPCSFGEYVFKQNDNIEEVTLPEWMTVVPTGFLYGDRDAKLHTVNLASATTKIGKEAFYQHSKLHDVYFPPTLNEFGESCFAQCGSSIQSFGTLTLNDEAIIGDYAFMDTYVDGIVFNGCANFGTGSLQKIHGVTKVAFPACMKDIPDSFCNDWSELTEVTLPEGIESIGISTFYKCKALKSIELPSTLTAIGEDAFNSSGIERLIMPDNDVKLGNSVFAYSDIKYIEFSHKQTKLPQYSFRDTKNVEEVAFRRAPEVETSATLTIGNSAFWRSSIPKIQFPDADLILEGSAFHTSEIASIGWPSDDKSITCIDTSQFTTCKNLTSVKLPGGLTRIPTYFLDCCPNLTYVELGANVESIGMRAFQSSGLKEIVWNDKLSHIESEAFTYCQFETLTFPHSLTSASNLIFGNNYKLKEVIFPENMAMTSIPSSAFMDCTSLDNVDIPSHIERIGSSAFSSCSSLTNVKLHNGLKTIESYAFSSSGLKKVEIPSTVTAFGKGNFSRCKVLEEVINHASAPIELNMFEYCSGLKRFYSDGNSVCSVCSAWQGGGTSGTSEGGGFQPANSIICNYKPDS